MTMQHDVRFIVSGSPDKNGLYDIHVDLSDYVLGYGNDCKIFFAIQKASGQEWTFIDIRKDILNMTTDHNFEQFEIDLGLLNIVRIK